jgi:hypothetical protein
MKIEYDLFKKDFIEFNMYRILNSDKIKSSLFKQRYTISLDVLVVIFILALIAGAPWKLFLSIVILIYILWITYYPKYFNNKAKRNIEKMIDERNDTSVFGKYTITVDEEGIVELSKSKKTKAHWSQVEKVIEVVDYIFIKTTENDTFIIPKSIFENIHLRNEFMSTIKQYHDIN